MKKWRIYSLAVILILSIQNKIPAQELELIKTTTLPNYPSASTVEFYQNRLYVIGDDAPYMLILDTDHKPIDSIELFTSEEKRIEKDEKADVEASVIISKEKKDYLVAFSSFATEKRNKTLVFRLSGRAIEKGNFKKKSSKFKGVDLKEINIEGAAYVNGRLILSNRANEGNKENHLIISHFDVEDGEQEKFLNIIALNLASPKNAIGISGMAYLADKDILLFTASTEKTSNTTSDGEIGESYLGYISNISKKLERKAIAPDKLIRLSGLLGRNQPQKIEAVAVEKSTARETILHLAADNDNGQSTLFKMRFRL